MEIVTIIAEYTAYSLRGNAKVAMVCRYWYEIAKRVADMRANEKVNKLIDDVFLRGVGRLKRSLRLWSRYKNEENPTDICDQVGKSWYVTEISHRPGSKNYRINMEIRKRLLWYFLEEDPEIIRVTFYYGSNVPAVDIYFADEILVFPLFDYSCQGGAIAKKKTKRGLITRNICETVMKYYKSFESVMVADVMGGGFMGPMNMLDWRARDTWELSEKN